MTLPQKFLSDSGNRDLIGCAVVVFLATALAVAPLIARPPPTDISPEEFSVARAVGHIENIASEPHPMGSAANARVRDYLSEELTALGLDVVQQELTAQDYYGSPGRTVDVVNVMARIPGQSPTRAVALVAHYDTVPWTFGANDNAAGVAAILEAARVLLAGPALRNDVILLFADGEEPSPRPGSRAFVADHPWAEDVGFVVNFEAAGGSGPSMVVEMNGPKSWLVDGLSASTPHPVAFSFLTETIELLGGIGTDFDPFRAKGVYGVHLAYSRGSPIYHTLEDSIGRVALSSLHQHGSYAVSLSRHFGALDLAAVPQSGNDVFFVVGRSSIVSYPVGWVVPLAILCALLFSLGATLRIRRLGKRGRSMLVGISTMLTAIVAGTLGSTLVWSLFTGMRQTPAVVESYMYLLGLLALAAATAATVWRVARRRWGDLDPAESVVLLWVVLVVASAAFAPGTSYLFVWPAIAGSIALVWEPTVASVRRVVVMAMVAPPTLVLAVPAIDTFFQFAQPRPGNPDSEVVEAVAVAMLLALLAIALIVSLTYQPTEVVSEAVRGDSPLNGGREADRLEGGRRSVPPGHAMHASSRGG